MRTDTGNKITEYIKTHQKVRAHDLVREFRFSHAAIHKQLRKLVERGILSKIGKPPLVYYDYVYTIDTDDLKKKLSIVDRNKDKIEKWYLYISPSGKKIRGFEGFLQWVRDIKQEDQFTQLVLEYIKTREFANKAITGSGWIDATHKIINTFSDVYIDKLLYQDFFALPKFGKTKLGQLVLYAKQSQSRELLKEVVDLVKPVVDKLIKHYRIEAVAFIPPTVPRNLQFVKELSFYLDIKLAEVKLDKIFAGSVRVPQKSLPKLEQRIENAKSTIFPKKSNFSFRRILLIDDAVGSGATFNEIAKKLRDDGVAKDKIIAYAVVGSMKGFDVISEI